MESAAAEYLVKLIPLSTREVVVGASNPPAAIIHYWKMVGGRSYVSATAEVGRQV